MKKLLLSLCMVLSIYAMEQRDKELFALAAQDPECLGSHKTISLLLDHEQKELLAVLGGVASPEQIVPIMKKKIGELHERTLSHIEPVPECIREFAIKNSIGIDRHPHISSDGKFLLDDDNLFCTHDGSVVNLENFPRESFNLNSKLGPAGKIIFALEGSYYYHKITAWGLPEGKQLYTFGLPDCIALLRRDDENKLTTVKEEATTEVVKKGLEVLHKDQQNYLHLLSLELIPEIALYLRIGKNLFRHFTISDDDKFLAMDTLMKGIQLYNARTGKFLRSLPDSEPYKWGKPVLFSPHCVFAITRLADDTKRELLVWQPALEQAAPICLPGDIACFNEDNRYIATANSATKEVKVWSLLPTTNAASVQLQCEPHRLRLSSNGRLLAQGGGRYKSQEIWDLKTGRCLYVDPSRSHKETVNALCDTVIKNSPDTTIQHLDTGTIIPLAGTQRIADSFVCDPAGKYLFIHKGYHGMELRNAKNGALIAALTHGGPATKGSCFMPENRLLTITGDKACLWQLHPIDWDAISPLEKMAMLSLENSYRTGKPFTGIALHALDKFKALAAKRYPQISCLSEPDKPIEPITVSDVSERYTQKKNGVEHILFGTDQYKNSLSTFMMISGSDRGAIVAYKNAKDLPKCEQRTFLSESEARRLYYLLYKQYNEQPKKHPW